MTQDNQLAFVNRGGPGYGSGAIEPWAQPGGGALGGPAAPTTPPLQKIHRLLRGRYVLAFLLALLGAAGGGFAGWVSQKPGYSSSGIIEIAPILPDPENVERVMLMYGQHMATQVARLKSERLIKWAVARPEWAKAGGFGGPGAVQAFGQGLKVTHVRNTSLIDVTFSHPEAQAARGAVEAVIRSYEEHFGRTESDTVEMQRKHFEEQRRRAENRIREDEEKIEALARDNGDDLAVLYQAKMQEQVKIEAMWRESERALRDAKTQSDVTPELAAEDIAAIEPTLAKQIEMRDAIEAEIEANRIRLAESHPTIVGLRHRLEMRIKTVDEFAKDWNSKYTGYVITPEGIVRRIPRNKDAMAESTNRLKVLYEEQKKAVTELQEVQRRINNLKSDIRDQNAKIEQAEKRLEEIRFRTEMASPPNIISYATEPVVANDGRIKFAMLGVMGGAALPVLLMLGIGLMDHRYRYSDEATDGVTGPAGAGNVTLLGILPNLPDRLSDPEQAAIAAHCVHQIRTMLQINGGPQERRVFAVTSASPGDGKTSLTLALGLSYAACGTRTLLIDCDLVGAGLTTRMNVSTPEGVLEAIANRSLLEYVRTTDIADVSILPVGSAHGHHASTLSPQALRRLIEEAEQHFDVVMIDTGPVLGSIEASLVCAAADGVVLTVSRGQQRPMVERSIAHLAAIGARMAGVVFNRAQASDFERSISGVSLRSVASSSGNGNGRRGAVRSSDAVGPVARAVAGHTRPSDESLAHGDGPRG